jgi:hypothetical protein
MKSYGRDRSHPRQQRFWGATPERPAPVPAAAAPAAAPAAPDKPRDLAKAGLWTAVLIWPIGAVIGVMLLSKDRIREGASVLAIASVVGVLSFTLLAPTGSADSCLDTAQGRTLCGADAVDWCKQNVPPPAVVRPASMPGTDVAPPQPLGSSGGMCEDRH